MKKSLKSALSLLGLSSTLLVTSLPLVTSCTTSNIRSSKILNAEGDVTKEEASKFISGATSGDVWYKLENNQYTLVEDDGAEPETTAIGSNIEFIDQPNLNDNAYLTTIDDLAFQKMDGYTGEFTGTVKFNEHLKVIGTSAFQMQLATTYDFSNLNLKNQLDLGKKAFFKNENLTTVTMFDNQATNVSFGESCFQGCKKLTKMTFPAGTLAVGINAFKDCSLLSEVTFANTDTNLIRSMTIGSGIFDNCSQLTKILVPNGTKSAYEEVFNNKIPSSITIEESYTPTPPPHADDTWTPAKIAGLVVGCVLIATAIALAIALPILKKQGKIGKKKRKSYKEPLKAEDEAFNSSKYQVGKIINNRKCPYCKHPLVVKKNKKGQKFIGCTNFPKCKYTESIEDEVRDFVAEKMK